ncbi:YciI family protein [Geothrix campi]|uniref:YciI family protein n=1 Tax=Geothrix campi TaxID=2966450 RepID=UPI0021494B86|nr:YciI family protein [Geothrix sp. SG10]
MRFLCLYKPSRPEGTPLSDQEMAGMNALIKDMRASGVLLATEGCMPSALGARVRLSNGTFSVTGGPFPESKELVEGYALIQANSRAEAIEHTMRFLRAAGEGESEIRQVWEP